MELQHSTLEGSKNTDQIITFKIADEEYGLEILRVKEVIQLKEVTKLPKTPQWVKGIINLRGDVIPVIDLRNKFGIKGKKVDAGRVIVVEVEKKSMGMLVDSVSHVIRIEDDQIDSMPLFGGSTGSYVRGVAKLGDRLIVLINIDKVLTTEEKIDLQRLKEQSKVA